MDRGLSTGTHQSHDGLRERNAPDSVAPGVESLAASGEIEPKDKAGSGGITFGRTPDGTGMSKPSLVVCCWRICGRSVGRGGVAGVVVLGNNPRTNWDLYSVPCP